MANETGWQLDQEKAGISSGEPVHFGVAPGLWQADGDPLTASQLGVSVDEMRALIKENDLPLKEVRSASASVDLNELRGGGHAESTDETYETMQAQEAELQGTEVVATEPEAKASAKEEEE